jgi:nucleoside-diphosphate-sugar epimerase
VHDGPAGEGTRTVTGQRVLVTGATGFIGSHLASRLARDGAEVHALVRRGSDAGRLASVRQQIHLHEGDVTDEASIRRAFAAATPWAVYHLAADTGVRRLSEGWAGVERSVRVNLQGTLAVLRGALEATSPVSVFVRAGGLEEYGTGPTPYDEAQREAPISPYSASQVAATHYCEMLQRGTATRIVTVRPALVYGPGQSSDFFIPSLIASCLRGAAFEMTAGTQHRDLLYIDDLVDALIRVATTGAPRGGVVNVGHGIEHAMRDVAMEIAGLTGRPDLLQIGARPERPGDLVHLVTRTERAAELLDWRPKIGLTEGLRRTIAWYRAHASAVERSRSIPDEPRTR